MKTLSNRSGLRGSIPDLVALRSLVIVAAILACSTGAVAQGFGRAATRPFSGRVNFEDKRKGRGATFWFDLAPSIRNTWKDARTELTALGIQLLNKRDIGGGFRTSRTSIDLAQNGDLYYGVDGTGITLRYVLSGNRIETSLRVPGPSPSGTDPRAYTTCDAEFTVNIDRSGSDLSVAPAKVLWRCSRPEGVNFTGKLAVAFNNFLKFLGGPDFIGSFWAPIRSGNRAVGQQVTIKLNSVLPKKREGGTFAFAPDGGAMKLTLEDEGERPKVH